MSNPKPPNVAMSDEIRGQLARAHRTQADLAAVLGVSQPQVSARMRGDVPWRVDELLKVAEWLDVAPSVLLGTAA